MRDAAEYGEQLLDLIEQAIDGNLNREEFERLLRRTVYTSLESTFRRGAKIPEGDNLFPNERIALEGILTNHETSINRMTDELYRAIELQRLTR